MMARINRACELLSVLICFSLLFFPGYMIMDAGEQRDLWWLACGLALFWMMFDTIFWPVFRAFILRK